MKIEKVIIDMDGQKLELTMEQARRLRMTLDELFPTPERYPIIIDRPVYPWPPYQITTTGDPLPTRPQITWQGDGIPPSTGGPDLRCLAS